MEETLYNKLNRMFNENTNRAYSELTLEDVMQQLELQASAGRSIIGFKGHLKLEIIEKLRNEGLKVTVTTKEITTETKTIISWENKKK